MLAHADLPGKREDHGPPSPRPSPPSAAAPTLLAQAGQQVLTPERLLSVRAAEALERAGGPGARLALAQLARESRSRWLKETFTGSLRRFGG
jgi:hypothetical protein